MENKDLKEKELREEEVNVYASCSTVLKIHCNHDCPFDSAFLSSAS